MRKILVLIILIIICTFYSLIITKSDNAKTVFNENLNNYDIYVLDISNNNISTNTLANYFDNIKILEIYPYINPIYKKIINMSSYSFNTILSNKKNISNFTTKYLYLLKKNTLNEELTKYSLNGIKINKVKIYASNNDINNLLNENNFKIVK